MLLRFLKRLPIGATAGTVMLAGALQLMGINLIGVGSGLLLNLLDVPNWSGGWFESLL